MKHRLGFLGALLPIVVLVFVAAGCDEKKVEDAPDAKPAMTASTPVATMTAPVVTATASATTTAVIEAADAGAKADAGKPPPAKK